MPIDPNILLGIRPPTPGPSILDTYEQITQLQDRKVAGEERRAAAQEKQQIRAQEAHYAEVLARATKIGPDGRPTIDMPTLLGGDVPPDMVFAAQKSLDEAATRVATLQTANLTAEEKVTQYLGSLANVVKDAGYHPNAFGTALVAAKARGALTPDQFDQLLQEATVDETAIQRYTDSAIARAGGEKPETGFTLSPGQTRYGAGGQVVASVPPATTSSLASGFTLSPGQTRYGPNGEKLAGLPDRPQAAGGGEAAANREALITAVIDNPGLWDQITPTERGRIAGELRRRGFTGFGKPLSDAALKQIAESKSAIAALTDLRATLKANEQYIGPLAGFQALNPYSDARKAQADIDRVRQRVGKALEGGVLRKEDEEKYKKILATLNDEPSTAIYKVDQLVEDITRDMQTYTNEQRLAGRRVASGTPAETTTGEAHYKVGDVVTVKGQRVRITKLLPNGKFEAVAAVP